MSQRLNHRVRGEPGDEATTITHVTKEHVLYNMDVALACNPPPPLL